MGRRGAVRRAVRRRVEAVGGDAGSGRRRTDGCARAGVRARVGILRGRTSDRGMTAIEFVLLTPVLFFMIFATVQFALYFWADHVAQAAAQAGARKARAEADENPGGWRGKAGEQARSYIRQLGPSLLVDPEVKAVHPGPGTVGVEVEAGVPTILPGMRLTVHAQSQGPVERFVEDRG
ncbi:TadE family protein [Streptomyces telluris]|uniref:Pilus assembly protein n=1 Tax=Streptomyces telluris TaxID=2720021 RepID=A0A9X2RL65_9ACTN|nr:TadE family protein [Streptomyces telluris]MCQ8769214.1 pilus assembly protein [Streptomyces telluris]